MSEQQIQKTESHITSLPREIDQSLAVALGEMVVAFGRLEDMFKVAIKRLENKKPFDQVIKEFSGGGGTLGKLVIPCRSHFPNLTDTCNKAENLNTDRQDFIHATFAAMEEGGYVRFRKLVGYMDLATDIGHIKEITGKTNSLIEELDQKTGSLLTKSKDSSKFMVTFSAPISRF
jgi:uncharacterized protein (UPF0297 family)